MVPITVSLSLRPIVTFSFNQSIFASRERKEEEYYYRIYYKKIKQLNFPGRESLLERIVCQGVKSGKLNSGDI